MRCSAVFGELGVSLPFSDAGNLRPVGAQSCRGLRGLAESGDDSRKLDNAKRQAGAYGPEETGVRPLLAQRSCGAAHPYIYDCRRLAVVSAAETMGAAALVGRNNLHDAGADGGRGAFPLFGPAHPGGSGCDSGVVEAGAPQWGMEPTGQSHARLGGLGGFQQLFPQRCSSTLVSHLGLVYNALGLYFLLRVFISGAEGIWSVAKFILILWSPWPLKWSWNG